jgi:hypothetical protein
MTIELTTALTPRDEQLSDEAKDYIRTALAKLSERAYRSHFWTRDVCPCPAKASDVADYV